MELTNYSGYTHFALSHPDVAPQRVELPRRSSVTEVLHAVVASRRDPPLPCELEVAEFLPRDEFSTLGFRARPDADTSFIRVVERGSGVTSDPAQVASGSHRRRSIERTVYWRRERGTVAVRNRSGIARDQSRGRPDRQRRCGAARRAGHHRGFRLLLSADASQPRQTETFARRLGATILRPYDPVSDLLRVVREDDGLQVDFMATIHGVKSFGGLRDRASTVDIDGVTILVAALADIVRSKRAANRPRDRAVLEILEKSLEEAHKPGAETRRARSRKRT